MKINLNDFVKFKLTGYGQYIYYHRFDSIIRAYPSAFIKPTPLPIDDEGYSKMQMWEFIQTFGPHIGMGSDKVVDPIELIVEGEPKVAVQEPTNPFQRVEKGDIYYYIDFDGAIEYEYEHESSSDDMCYKDTANYCTDKTILEKRALHEALSRQLWRFSEENGGDLPWDGVNKHWHIVKTISSDAQPTLSDMPYNAVVKLEPRYDYQSIRASTIYFGDRLTAVRAIEEIVKPFLEAHPDFVW